MGAALMALSACETANPLVVCSADWISWRTDRAMQEFGRSSTSSLKTIRQVSRDYQTTGKFNAVQLISLANALNNLITDFRQSQALRDIQTLQNTCNDPTILKLAFTRFLYDQGAPQSLIDFLNEMDQYQRLLDSAGRG